MSCSYILPRWAGYLPDGDELHHIVAVSPVLDAILLSLR